MPFLGERHQNIFMVSWTCRRALLNWPTLRSGGVFRLRGATAISQQARAAEGLLGKMPSRSILEGAAVARYCYGAFPGCRPWRYFAVVRFQGCQQWQYFVVMLPPRALADGKMLANCAPPRPTVARSRRDAFSGGDPWQLFRFMRSRRGLGREKRQFAATYRRHVSKMSWLWQDMRAVHPKSPANGRSGIHRAKILP